MAKRSRKNTAVPKHTRDQHKQVLDTVYDEFQWQLTHDLKGLEARHPEMGNIDAATAASIVQEQYESIKAKFNGSDTSASEGDGSISDMLGAILGMGALDALSGDDEDDSSYDSPL